MSGKFTLYFKSSLLILLVSFSSIKAQNFQDISFGKDSTLDIVTWNIERFPKNGTTTINNVKDIILNLNADIIAIQEVRNIDSFNKMFNGLTDYDGYLESEYFQGLAYIYKKDVVKINSISEIYTTSEYWSYFPRNPMVMDFNYKGQRFIIINNHLKCCGDGTLDLHNSKDQETRRLLAIKLLKDYIDENYPNENVILLGDLNDILTDNDENNVFIDFIEDANNYLFVDMDIAKGNSTNWSFPTWPSHLDHILISNELFDEFENQNSSVEVIKLEEYFPSGWSQYDTNVTDHRPVGLKLVVEKSLSVTDVATSKVHFKNYPNPFKTSTTFSVKNTLEADTIEIYNTRGQRIKSIKINPNKTEIFLNASQLSTGVYFSKLIANKRTLATTKLVVIK